MSRIAAAARLACIAVSSTVIVAAAPVPTGTIQSYDNYKSWLVACDNTLRCLARGFAENENAQIEILRDAGPAGSITMSLKSPARFAAAEVRVDGTPLDLQAADWTSEKFVDGTAIATSKPALIRALVARLRNGAKVSLGSSAVPLDGFAAAMLRIDERQGRIGGVTALIRPGPAPAAEVPPAPAMPRIPKHPITAAMSAGEARQLIATVRARQKAVLAKEECDAAPTGMTAEAYPLDGRQALVLIPCLMGAYQGSSLGFITDRKSGAATLFNAPLPYLGSDRDADDGRWLTNGEFDPRTGMLFMSAKGRGLADCGTSASWIWDGSRFRLASLNMQRGCGGFEPGDWPALYRSIQ